jgi:hypothetical protein
MSAEDLDLHFAIYSWKFSSALEFFNALDCGHDDRR